MGAAELRAHAVPLLALAGVAGTAWPEPVGRAILTLPLLTVLPGWALAGAAMRDRPAGLAGIVYAAGLSLAADLLVGLVLYLWGRPTSLFMAGSLAALTIGFWLLAPKPQGDAGAWTLPSRPALLGAGALVAVCGLLVGGAVSSARVAARAHNQYSWTEFWMLPVRGSDGRLVRIGIRNREKAPTRYRIALMEGDRMVGQWPPFALAADEEVVQEVSVARSPGPPRRIEAWLYRADDLSLVYRKTWTAVAAPPSFVSGRSPKAATATVATDEKP